MPLQASDGLAAAWVALQFEALQYYQRHNCLWQLEDYTGVIRDTERNLAVIEFVQRHAETEDLAWALMQFKPQLIHMQVRARATESLRTEDYEAAIEIVTEGLDRIKDFFRENTRQDMPDHGIEINGLKSWLDELNTRRPLSPREKLEQEINDAVNNEDYEKAAQMRDALRNLKPSE